MIAPRDDKPANILRDALKAAVCTAVTVTVTKLVELGFEKWKGKPEETKS